MNTGKSDSAITDLALGWYNLRTSVKKCYTLRPGCLLIHASAYQLDQDESPSLLLRRQIQFSIDWSTELVFHPKRRGEEAGTCLCVHWHQVEAIEFVGTGDRFEAPRS